MRDIQLFRGRSALGGGTAPDEDENPFDQKDNDAPRSVDAFDTELQSAGRSGFKRSNAASGV